MGYITKICKQMKKEMTQFSKLNFLWSMQCCFHKRNTQHTLLICFHHNSNLLQIFIGMQFSSLWGTWALLKDKGILFHNLRSENFVYGNFLFNCEGTFDSTLEFRYFIFRYGGQYQLGSLVTEVAGGFYKKKDYEQVN